MADRIALLLPDLRGGGAERVNINLANDFVARGYSVDMVLMRATGDLMPLLDSKVRVVDLGARRMRNVFRPLTRYLRETRPASLLSCMWPLTIVAPIAGRAAKVGTRVVVAEHNTWSVQTSNRSSAYRFIVSTTMRLVFPHVDHVVNVSDGASEDLARFAHLPRELVKTIYNPVVGVAKATVSAGVDMSLDWSSGGHKKIVAVGSLKTQKDYPTLLRAFAHLRRGTDAKLLVLGEGEERAVLERLIEELDIGADVCLPGFVGNTEAYYQNADLYVLSSIYEGLPTVLIEALEQGTPVVSTDCPSGPREILDHGRYGTLVPVGDPEALAQAMQHALARTHDNVPLKARAADFSVTKAADAYLDLLLPSWRQAPSLEEVHR